MSAAPFSLARRTVLKTGAGAGLLLAFELPARALGAEGAAPVTVNAWLRITTDGHAIVYVNSTDLGQGSQSGIAQVIAEEAGLSWDRVAIEQAPVTPTYFKPAGGYSTGGSGAVRAQWDSLRKAAAAAREMLRQAAAERWGCAVADCQPAVGKVRHLKTGRELSYADLAASAARCQVPADPPLTDRAEWRLIGKPVQRLDIPVKVNGAAIYGIDVKLPGMLTAAVAQCPIFGGALSGMDQAAGKAVPGVRQVARLAAWRDTEYVNMPLQETVAVVADSYWSASQGLGALKPQWTPPAQPFSSERLFEALRQDLDSQTAPPGGSQVVAVREGADEARQRAQVRTAFSAAARVIEATYEVPMVAHATMEPMTAVARWQGDTLEVWSGSQAQSDMKAVMSRRFGVAPEKVVVHTAYAGGGFGRRYYADAQIQAAALAKAVGAPVKVIWSRPEDIQHDMYRPPAVARFRAAVGKSGAVEAVETRQARIARFDFDDIYKGLKYDWPALICTGSMRPQDISWGAWRSVEHGPQAFFIESFVDEVAHALEQDPIAYRRSLLAQDPRSQRLLDVLAERSGWRQPKPAGVGRGVAFAPANNSLAAQVAEVSLENGALKVRRVICAFDCGTVVNPDHVRAQGESAILFGLSAALTGEITFKDGRVQQANFDSYPVIRLKEAPEIEVHLVESGAEIGGVGEPMLPPIAPAVANAVFDLTGQRVRRLPIAPALKVSPQKA